MSTYLDELKALLREGGVPAEQVEATVSDLAAYVAETGADPEEEFGPVGDFAGQLLTARAPGADPADATEWRWTADIFAGMAVGACVAIAALASMWFWMARRRP